MIKIVSVKFKDGGKPYYFEPNGEQLSKGDGVVVETAKGQEFGTVIEAEKEVEESRVVQPLRPVIRKATEKDLALVEQGEQRKGEAMKVFREKVAERQLEMKPIGCEFSFDQTKVTFYFTAENRVDFRELIRDLSAAFHMRIELRQINIREEIKFMGGIGPCGRECCCMKALSEPKKVSVKMAKNQNLSLNPEKISGLCGRLMCCLSYENDYYAEIAKRMPKVGGQADTPDGRGTVVNVNMLDLTVKVKIENGEMMSYRDYPVDSIAFMKGNVLIGKVPSVADKLEKAATETKADNADEEQEPKEEPAKKERRGDRNRSRGQNGEGGRNRERGAEGEKPEKNQNQNRGHGKSGEGGNGQNSKKSKNRRQNNQPHGQNGEVDNRKNGDNFNREKREGDNAAPEQNVAQGEGRKSRNRRRNNRGNRNGNNNKRVENNEQLATANNKLASANNELATANNKKFQKKEENQ